MIAKTILKELLDVTPFLISSCTTEQQKEKMHGIDTETDMWIGGIKLKTRHKSKHIWIPDFK